MTLIAEERPFTIRRLTTLLGVPPWTLRRLERRGVLPRAPRKILSGERYWYPSEVPELRRKLEDWRKV
jgi:DNA-binding transcriptional MerR regulator